MKPEEKLRIFKERYNKELKKALKDVTKETGEMALEMLIKRTKAGFGVTGKLDSLSQGYIDFRKRWSAFLADDTTPEKSNLTATGQLLDALFLRVVATKFIIRVNSKNRSEGLGGEAVEAVKKDLFKGKGKDRKKVGEKAVDYQSKLTNEDVRKFVEEAGRVFLEFNEQEKYRVRRFAKELLREELRQILKTK